MRVVIVGATGLLGRALGLALAARGAHLLCTARDPVRAKAQAPHCLRSAQWVAMDLREVPAASRWQALLQHGDVVINAAGIIREQRPGDFEAIHHEGPARLMQACAQAHVRLLVQISALGASPDAATGYFRSKGRAEERLRQGGVPFAIVRPSLVWSDDGASAGLFAALAVLPVTALPGGGQQRLQPVHLHDVVRGVLALIDSRAVPARTVAFVGPHAVSLRAYLASLRAQLGLRRAPWVLTLPIAVFRWAAALAGRLRASLLDRESADMLLQGNAADAQPFTALLGRPPRSHTDFVGPGSAALQRAAWLFWMLPLLRYAVAAVWIWTFAVSIGLYPREQSLALLARVGADGLWADTLLTGAALVNLALGVATLVAAAAWRARWLWPLQLALITFYTAVITWALPEYWLHPFGPLSKNLPMCAAIALLWALDLPGAARSSQSRRGR